MKQKASFLFSMAQECSKFYDDAMKAKLSETLDITKQKVDAFRDSTYDQYLNFKKYVESGDFETHIDTFAREIGFDFSTTSILMEKRLLNSQVRKIRVGAKLKVLLWHCAGDVSKVGGVAAAAGRFFGPKGAGIGAIAGSGIKIVFYAAVFYGIAFKFGLEQSVSPDLS